MPIFAISAGMLIVIGFATMFAGINDDLEDPWTPVTRTTSDSGAHAMMPQRPATAQQYNTGPQPITGQQPALSQLQQQPLQPLQPLPTRQPAASIAARVFGKPATAMTSRGAVGSTLRLRPLLWLNSSASPATSLIPRALSSW